MSNIPLLLLFSYAENNIFRWWRFCPSSCLYTEHLNIYAIVMQYHYSHLIDRAYKWREMHARGFLKLLQPLPIYWLDCLIFPAIRCVCRLPSFGVSSDLRRGVMRSRRYKPSGRFGPTEITNDGRRRRQGSWGDCMGRCSRGNKSRTDWRRPVWRAPVVATERTVGCIIPIHLRRNKRTHR